MEKIHITKEKPEIDKLLAEGHKPISIRDGVEYVFRLQVEEAGEKWTEDRGQQTRDRGQRTEDPGRRSPVSGQSKAAKSGKDKE